MRRGRRRVSLLQQFFGLFPIPKYLCQIWSVAPVPSLSLPPSHLTRLKDAEQGGEGVGATEEVQGDEDSDSPLPASTGDRLSQLCTGIWGSWGEVWGDTEGKHGIHPQRVCWLIC